MVGSTNGGYFINRVTSTTAAPLKAYWDSLGLQPEENVEGQGRSDDYYFQQAGIPTSGYAAGASARKTSSQAAKWGGTANSAYDPCYHRSCDTTANVSATVLNRAADGVAYALWQLAVSGGTPTCVGGQVVGNGGFESGNTTWTASSGVITNASGQPARTGSYKAWLNGYGSTRTESLYQSVTLPAGCATYTLSFWLHIDTAETTGSTAYDRLAVQAGFDHAGDVLESQRRYRLRAAQPQRGRVRRADGDAAVHRHRGLVVADHLRDRRRDVAGELTAYPKTGRHRSSRWRPVASWVRGAGGRARRRRRPARPAPGG